MIRQLTLVLLVLMSWPLAIRAADDQTEPTKPQSPPAKAAIDKADHTVGEASAFIAAPSCRRRSS